MPADITVIGGGIVGLATAYALAQRDEVDSVRLLEKEPGLARHQSTNNSGVLHAGLQYTPGSEKARLAREGIRRMTDFCRHHGIQHEICGKLVVATRPDELGRLDDMLERGRANGLQGLRRLSPGEVAEIEPHVQCVAAIQVPEEGIVSYEGVTETLARELRGLGADLVTGAGVRRLKREGGHWHISTTAGGFTSRVIVNCAGLHVDRIAAMAGSPSLARILPFRGEYQRIRPERAHLVKHLVYPLPEPGFPFLGVHFTRRVDGTIDAGPNAVLAFAREGYSLGVLNLKDLADALSYPGLWRFAFRHRGMVARELGQSVDRRRFIRALRRLIPEIEDRDLVPGGAGVRAQAMLPNGGFVHDFLWSDGPGAVHVVNAPSPAATASLVIGEEIAARAVARLED